LPGVIEGDDKRLWVGKFRGAGQGAGALLAEVVAGKLAEALALPMPEMVCLQLPPRFGITDGDPEINSLLGASEGDNFGLAFLPQAIGYDPAAAIPLDGTLAAKIVVFDVLISNVDRTFRNPNLIWSGGSLWIIDHGAALYWQHGWDGSVGGAPSRLPRMKDHVLLPLAGDLGVAAEEVKETVTDARLRAAFAAVPAAWFGVGEDEGSVEARRAAFVERMKMRRDELVRLVGQEGV
jgi:hypothetical protein